MKDVNRYSNLRMKKNKKKYQSRKGFSIVEVMLSLVILEVGIVGILSLIVTSITNSANSRDRIVASQLAQEGIEVVRNIRDNSWAVGDGAFDDFVVSTKCAINKDTQVLELSVGGNCHPASDPNKFRLYIDSNNFFAHDASGEGTSFQRKVGIADNGGSNQTITSMVIWKRDGADFPDPADCTFQNRCVYTQATLTDWIVD
jgi:type II secretory pathway pseudopilin PulG